MTALYDSKRQCRVPLDGDSPDASPSSESKFNVQRACISSNAQTPVLATRRDALHRLPTELLVEIFQHFLDPAAHFNPRSNAPWLLSHVCRHWRSVALGSPRLWRRFVLPDDLQYFKPTIDLVAVQLERARNIPLSLHLSDVGLGQKILDLFLPVSARWEDAEVILDTSNRFFLTNFPVLWKLVLETIWDIPASAKMVDSLPALRHLELRTSLDRLPPLLFPWSQLTVCSLSGATAVNALRILSQLSAATEFSLAGSRRGMGTLVKAEAPITTLALTNSLSAATHILNHLTAPNLDTLTLEDFDFWDGSSDGTALSAMLARVPPFLERSSCLLRRITINCAIAGADLFCILESPYVQGIVHLDLNVRQMKVPGLWVTTVTSRLPNLGILILRECRQNLLSQLEEAVRSTPGRKSAIRRAPDLFDLGAPKEHSDLEVIISDVNKYNRSL
ncbi:hypothetical protein C8F04DRAFT_1129563 [Mycena alexandri]|uniref:F-box domain-containing protein n=1 Tax=Mycena alexandri TaxID=1745969 RepID=A0AAD6SGV5_9AGAR|nr:hypothetical protein C8F04DRAFT_1129563 [Mycena alexandri]